MEDFRKIEELLGWDLNDEAVQQLREARRDCESCIKDAYVNRDKRLVSYKFIQISIWTDVFNKTLKYVKYAKRRNFEIFACS